MSEADKRKKDRDELDELYKSIEHNRNEDIALRAIKIARYWLVKAENQAAQIKNLENRNKTTASDYLFRDMAGKEWLCGKCIFAERPIYDMPCRQCYESHCGFIPRGYA